MTKDPRPVLSQDGIEAEAAPVAGADRAGEDEAEATQVDVDDRVATTVVEVIVEVGAEIGTLMALTTSPKNLTRRRPKPEVPPDPHQLSQFPNPRNPSPKDPKRANQ